MANEDVIKRKGITITLRDGKDYTVLPLPIDDLIDVLPIITKLEDKGADINKELLDNIKTLVYTALKSSNDIDKSEVGKLVDLSDLQEIIKVIMGQKKSLE